MRGQGKCQVRGSGLGLVQGSSAGRRTTGSKILPSSYTVRQEINASSSQDHNI